MESLAFGRAADLYRMAIRHLEALDQSERESYRVELVAPAILYRGLGDALRLGGTLGKSVPSLLDLPDRMMAPRPSAWPRR